MPVRSMSRRDRGNAVVVGVEPEPRGQHRHVVAPASVTRQGEEARQHACRPTRARTAGGATPGEPPPGRSRRADRGEHDRRPSATTTIAVDQRGTFGPAAGRDHAELELRGEPRGQDAADRPRLRDERWDQDQDAGDRGSSGRWRASSSAPAKMSSDGARAMITPAISSRVRCGPRIELRTHRPQQGTDRCTVQTVARNRVEGRVAGEERGQERWRAG